MSSVRLPGICTTVIECRYNTVGRRLSTSERSCLFNTWKQYSSSVRYAVPRPITVFVLIFVIFQQQQKKKRRRRKRCRHGVLHTWLALVDTSSIIDTTNFTSRKCQLETTNAKETWFRDASDGQTQYTSTNRTEMSETLRYQIVNCMTDMFAPCPIKQS